jgi:DegV family protein with EDD domain
MEGLVVMSKIAIVTDSNSGITQAQAKELGITVIPMPFFIDEVEYYEDITLTQEEFYKKLENDAQITTSQPSMESVLKIWNELLTTYDEIVHIPMSSGLSSSCATAIMLADDYDGKVQVVNNQRISITQRQSVLDAMMLADRGMSALEIKEYLEETKMESSIYITLDTLRYLKKGGRITPAAAAFASLLRIKPVLQIQGKKLDAFAKCRTLKASKKTMIDAIKNDCINRFDSDEKATKVWIQIAYSGTDRTEAEKFHKELCEIFPNHEIIINALSLSVSCHIGPGSLAIACVKQLKEYEN